MEYRDNGAIGALLDEYERSIKHLFVTIKNISNQDLCVIVDRETKEEDCRSIQTILRHVVRAGYAYATYIRRHQGEKIDHVEPNLLTTADQYISEIKTMFSYTEKVFIDFPKLAIEKHNAENKILVGWGQRYDVEQLMEHAIVHILRHRRQIERFILKINEL